MPNPVDHLPQGQEIQPRLYNQLLQKVDSIREWSQPFVKAGYINAAVFLDLEEDGRPDLALATEWGPVKVFHNSSIGFIDQTSSLGLNTQTGRSTSVTTGDFDNDGKMDLVAGNKRLNTSSALHHHSKERIWFGSNSRNNQVESIESFLSGENWLPNRD